MSYWSRNFLFRFRMSSLKKESFQIFWNFFFKSSRESTKSSANIYCLEFFLLEFSSDFDSVLCFQFLSKKCISVGAFMRRQVLKLPTHVSHQENLHSPVMHTMDKCVRTTAAASAPECQEPQQFGIQ